MVLTALHFHIPPTHGHLPPLFNSSARPVTTTTNHHHRVSVHARTMAAVMPATPTPPMMMQPPMTTTVPLPGYQVSGAGAAVPGHGTPSSGSIGAFFGVLAAVLVLTVLSCVFGRVCAAQAEGPDEWYDCTRLLRRRRRAPRRAQAQRPLVPAEEAKQPAEPPLPLPEP